MAGKKGFGLLGWAALLSIGGNLAQAAAFAAEKAARRSAEDRLVEAAAARERADERARRAEAERDEEVRAREAADLKLRRVIGERDAERTEHEKTKAALSQAQVELSARVRAASKPSPSA